MLLSGRMHTRQVGLFRHALSRSDNFGQVPRHCWAELTKGHIRAGAPRPRSASSAATMPTSKSGVNIVLRALEAPIRQIAENAGVEGSIVVGKVLENKSQTFGFDAQTEQYVDMLSAGIVDPAKVVRVALQDAASVAGLMITTEAMVAETPKKKEAPAMPGAAWAGWTIDQLRCPPRGRHHAAPKPTPPRRRTRV